MPYKNIMNEQLIREKILNLAQKKGQIVYGARATNVQLPTYLRKKTEDYDILTKKPKKSARELVNELKKVTGKDFKIEKAQHKGTYKIKLGDKTIVDYTQLKKLPKIKESWGIKYKDLSSIKKSTRRLIKKPSAEFRRDKDLSTLDRIKQLEELEKRFNI
jgi:hypothetical protein